MSVRRLGELAAIVKIEISATEIEALLTSHAEAYPGASRLEERSAEIESQGFPNEEALRLVRDVCLWGGGDRFVDRVAGGGVDDVSTPLRNAVALADKGRTVEALAEIQKIAYLGQSFASKQLRFLRPERAVILDSVVRANLGYPETGLGYASFLADCAELLGFLTPKARRPSGKQLRLCDVEAALFAKIQGV